MQANETVPRERLVDELALRGAVRPVVVACGLVCILGMQACSEELAPLRRSLVPAPAHSDTGHAPYVADAAAADATAVPAPGPGFTIYPLSPSASSVAPGGTFSFAIKLAYVGPALTDDYEVFLHLVGPGKPDWFDHAVYPVPGPKSSTWAGVTTFSGTLAIPASASGTYTVMAGVHHATPGAETANIRMSPATAAVAERFAAGAIGYRYAIGTVAVTTAGGPTLPVTPPTTSPGWAQAVIDDMTTASEATLAKRGSGTMTAYASLGSIGGTGGNYDSIVGICSGVCDHFAQNVAGAISWTWIWAGAQNNASHSLVLARRARGYYLSKSTGQWVLAFESRPVGVPEQIDETTGTGAQLNPDTQVAVDAMTTSLKPDAFYKYELWGQATIGHTAFQDAKAWFFSTQLSVTTDGSGIDDRASSEFIVKVGADFYTAESLAASDYPGARARYINIANGQLTAGVCDTCYPYVVMDGLGGRYRKIPTDGSWITVTAISMSPTFGGSALPPPWGDYSVPSPYAQPPYALTASEILANPPPQ